MFGIFPSASARERNDESPIPSKPRPKRHQVNRACAWCRTYRIKCDSNHPCGNCIAKGRKCSAEGSKDQARTFPSAIKEIESLREKVRELENQIKNLQLQKQARELSPELLPSNDSLGVKQEDTLPEELDPLSQHGGNKQYYNWDFVTQEIRPGSNQIHGPSSTYYFINQLSSYLDTSLEQKFSESQKFSTSLAPLTARELFCVFAGRHTLQLHDTAEQQDLPRSQEERLLELYWSSWHHLYPILDQEAFDNYYATLWSPHNSFRNPSALVDIIIALCMQYEAALLASRMTADDDLSKQPTDSTAGRWFYRRCNYFLQDELETPSITVFQCHLLAVVWLNGAQWHNAAHNVLAAGLRVGVVLGLHLEPCPELSTALREYRRRIWWTMYSMDMQYAIQFGRPLGVNLGQVTCKLPSDDCALRNQGLENQSRSGFITQMIRLTLASRAIYVQFYRVCAQVLRQSGQVNIYNDLNGLETCAKWMDMNIRYLKAWLKQVPDAFKTRRKHLGQSYSTDRSRLDLTSPGDSMSRNRLVLELAYHQYAMELYRPFIAFAQIDDCGAEVTERHAIACADHATTITLIIHQDIKESENLKAWQMICSWQWNAALCLAGYMLTYPRGPTTVSAREALKMAISTFALLSTTFTNAINAGTLLQALLCKIDVLVGEAQFSSAIERTRVQSHSLPSASLQDLLTIAKPFKETKRPSNVNDSYTRTSCAFDQSQFGSPLDFLLDEDHVFEFLDFDPTDPFEPNTSLPPV